MRVAFGPFVFDSDRRELLEGERPVHLAPKAFRLLELLIAGSPRAIAKRELIEGIWPDTFVEESNLAGLVNEVRQALGERSRRDGCIRTVHGFGYAFTAHPVSAGPAPRPVAAVVFRGEELRLREGANVVGRDPANGVPIDDRTVSRRHARITLSAGSATIEDLGSKNGTFVDGQKLDAPAPLADGQTVILGDARLQYRSGSGSTTVTRATSSRRRG
jgi:DNA-binding winged helix-turn-helix (wHTH) protein